MIAPAEGNHKQLILLCLLYHVELMLWGLPHGLEDDTEMVADGELVIKLIAGSCGFNLCQNNLAQKLNKSNSYTAYKALHNQCVI